MTLAWDFYTNESERFFMSALFVIIILVFLPHLQFVFLSLCLHLGGKKTKICHVNFVCQRFLCSLISGLLKKISRYFYFCFVKKNGVRFDKFTFLIKSEFIKIYFVQVFTSFNIF